ncbi:phage tail sheath subtilisin-like domain-containing protein [bacterium]|nr:phage tail sheath subtilisin-like domain-containing protein [bacterium]
MALKLSESPNIVVKEIDLSGVVPAVTSSTGALVGDFNWGPAEQPILVGNEAELAANFGAPSLEGGATSTDFLSAAYFLKYSTNTFVTRAVADSDYNAVAAGSTTTQVKNLEDFNSQTLTSEKVIAKYPGTVGNSLKVSICPAVDSAFENWAYVSSFDAAPSTSDYVSSRSSATGDEVHMVVVDEDGVLTGSKGTVLETFPFVSLVSDAKTSDGSSNYALDALNDRSAYVWGGAIDFNTAPVSSWDSAAGVDVVDYSLTSGNRVSKSVGDYLTAFDQYEDDDTIQVDFLIAPQMASQVDQTAIVTDLVATATDRKDCVVVSSPHRDAVVGVNNPTEVVDSVKAFADAQTASSYLVLDNNFLKVYDKYNDEYVFIPAASSTAGLMASTDFTSAPWFSPAGSRRGQYLGVTSLAYSATKSQRDKLYKASVNPIVNLPGQGILLYGDKTKLGRPSAFDRINVRRLFLVMERAIKQAAQGVMFEFNDEFTRAEFVNIVEPFLREIKGRRGISDFRVVCDETNNTADVIDNNSFVASIFVKPARSINYVTLNFVAVRTGVDFEEVVGIV